MFGMMKPPPPPKPGVPIACLKRAEGRAVCYREFDERDEYVFQDTDYAMKHYRNNTTIRVCPDCAKIQDQRNARDVKDQSPLATRGLDMDNL